MKKVISCLLIFLLFFPFSLCVNAQEKELEAPVNVALGKSYTAPEAVRGYTADLTDGKAETKFEPGSSEWYGLFCNFMAEDQNCPDGKGTIVIDLGDYYDLDAVRIHYHIDDSIGAAPPISVYLSTDRGIIVGLNNDFYAAGETWSTDKLNGITARYVTISFDIWTYWVLINEIEIYGTKATMNTNIALGASYEAPEATRGYTANLTDGKVSDVFEPASPNWYGLFCNEQTIDENAPAGRESVIIDLGNYYDLTRAEMHIAADDIYGISAPLKVEVFGCTTPEDGFVSIGELEVYGYYGVFWIYSNLNAERVRYVRFDITLGNYWAMLDEIEIFGTLSEKGVPYMVGDMSGDGEISSRDYAMLKRCCLGIGNFSDEQIECADINQDGKINSKDYALLKRHCVGISVIKDKNSYVFNIDHKIQSLVPDDRLGDLSHIPDGNIAVFGNSFIGTSQICQIFNELSSDNGQTRKLIDYQADYYWLLNYVSASQLKSEGYSAVLLCGFYSSEILNDLADVYSNFVEAGIEIIIFPAHNENRMLLNTVAIRYPELYIMDWKAEIDMLINSGIDRWDMCIDDAHDHSTPLAGYVGAHMVYRAIYGEIPDSTQLNKYITYDYLKSILGDYVETGIVK